MADIVPAAIALLEPALRARLRIVQQARDEDLARVRDAYAALSVAAEVAPFFSGLPGRIAASHLVVARSGASTVAELAAIGRPSILVPLPHAIDQDQLANAGVLERAGGALRLVQDAFTPERLAAVQRAGRPAILDFYADWCTPCRQLSDKTFHHAAVVRESGKFTMIKVDLTRESDPDVMELVRKYEVRGVPTVLFLDSRGNELKALQTVDFVPGDEFLLRMKKALES
jgi:thiol:disulfide interchange protein